MACRVGITTNVERRKREHQADFRNFRDWEVLVTELSRQDAQLREYQEAQRRGCSSHGGGSDPDDQNATWSVYCFEHDGKT